MGIEELVDRILRDAGSEAEAIGAGAESSRAEILRAADAEAEKRYWSTFNRLKLAAEEERKRRVALGRLEARRTVLAEKRRRIDGVFEAAREKFLEQDERDYVETLAGMLASMPAGEPGEVMFSPADRAAVGDRVVAAANGLLEREGRARNFALSGETREMAGGFVLRSGGVEVDASVDSLVGQARERLQGRVVEILFGDGDGEGGET